MDEMKRIEIANEQNIDLEALQQDFPDYVDIYLKMDFLADKFFPEYTSIYKNESERVVWTDAELFDMESLLGTMQAIDELDESETAIKNEMPILLMLFVGKQLKKQDA